MESKTLLVKGILLIWSRWAFTVLSISSNCDSLLWLADSLVWLLLKQPQGFLKVFVSIDGFWILLLDSEVLQLGPGLLIEMVEVEAQRLELCFAVKRKEVVFGWLVFLLFLSPVVGLRPLRDKTGSWGDEVCLSDSNSILLLFDVVVLFTLFWWIIVIVNAFFKFGCFGFNIFNSWLIKPWWIALGVTVLPFWFCPVVNLGVWYSVLLIVDRGNSLSILYRISMSKCIYIGVFGVTFCFHLDEELYIWV